MWRVSSRSGVVTLQTSIHLLLTYLLSQVFYCLFYHFHSTVLPSAHAVGSSYACLDLLWSVCVGHYRESFRMAQLQESRFGVWTHLLTRNCTLDMSLDAHVGGALLRAVWPIEKHCRSNAYDVCVCLLLGATLNPAKTAELVWPK